MARRAAVPHTGEALVLRTWPFHEADLLVSLLTREQGVVKGVARYAMRSRRRFGGALEPGTLVMAHYAERPREDLVRLDSFEIVWSPLRAPLDWLRVAGMQLVLEVIEQALPEQAPEDNVFRLAVTVLEGMEPASGLRAQGSGSREERGTSGDETGSESAVWLAVTYFGVWMCRLMGWWPELRACAACGVDLRGQAVWWSPLADGVTCEEDCRRESRQLSAASVAESSRMSRTGLQEMLSEGGWLPGASADLREFAIGLLERHLERRLRSAQALH